MKQKTYKNEKRYKNYKNIFERIKQRSKKNYFANLLTKHQNNAKKLWQTIKEAIGKTKIKANNFRRKMKIENEEIYDPAIIADSFNTYFTTIGLSTTIQGQVGDNIIIYIERPVMRSSESRDHYHVDGYLVPSPRCAFRFPGFDT